MSRPRYAVLGLGQFGAAVATELARLGIDVLAVDSSTARVDALKDKVVSVAVADVRDREALREILSSRFDGAVIAIGDHLEAEILATLFLKELGFSEIVVEAKTPERGEVLRRVGATRTVSPELEFGARLARRLATPNLLEFVPLAKGHGVIEVEAPAWSQNKTLAALDLRKRFGIAVISIVHGDGTTIMIPGGDATVRPGSRITLVGSEENLARFREQV